MPVMDVWLTPLPKNTTRLWSLSSSLVIFLVTTCSKVFLGIFNKPTVYGRRTLYDMLDSRPNNRSLITVCNHPSTIDDTLLCYMLRWSDVFSRSTLRWLPGAKDVCFRTRKGCYFFQLGRVLPVARGDGVYQHGMDFCVDRLSEGGWVHMYPEGKVNQDNTFMRLKWGVGRLVADSHTCPFVLPYWHIGMEDVMPKKRPYIPQRGKRLTVLFGEPLDFEVEVKLLKQQQKSDMEIRKYVTDKIQEEFARLKKLTEELHRQTDPHNNNEYTSSTT